MPLLVKAVTSDLDLTAVRFTDDQEGFFATWEAYQVDRTEVKRAMELLYDRAQFTFARIIDMLKADYPRVTDPFLFQRLKEWFYQTLRAYPDTNEHLSHWQTEVPVVILTFGDPEHQWEKLHFAKIPYSEARFATLAYSKVDHLRELLRHHGSPIVFIDDRTDTLDQVRSEGLTEDNIITCQIQRSDKQNPFVARYPHHLVRNFAEVDRLIRR